MTDRDTDIWAACCTSDAVAPTHLTPADLSALRLVRDAFKFGPNGAVPSAVNEFARTLVTQRRHEYVPPKPWAKIARARVQMSLGSAAPPDLVDAFVTLILWGKKLRPDFPVFGPALNDPKLIALLAEAPSWFACSNSATTSAPQCAESKSSYSPPRPASGG